MGDYEHSTTIDADPETVFAYVADVARLPEYFDGLRDARRSGPESVHVVAEVEGQTYEGEAWMHADPDAKNMRWGAETPSDYRGELFVTGIGETSSRVTVTLHTERADGPGVRAGLEGTLASLKRQFDGSGVDRG